MPNLVRQALSGQPITVYGNGEQRRCFCHVRDVVRTLCALLDREDLAGKVFNIGSTEEVSILELARRVQAATGADSGITLVPYE